MSAAKAPPRAVARKGAGSDVAYGPGPRWLRISLAVLALLYFGALLHHPMRPSWLRPAAFFTEATALFPRAVSYALEYRLAAWSCSSQGWQPIDPRPYFPIQPDDKESRFQRLGYFYERSRPAMQALAAYILAGHAAGIDDGVTGPIGGIELIKLTRPIPEVGTPIERYHYDPLAPIPPGEGKETYYTQSSERRRRCGSS